MTLLERAGTNTMLPVTAWEGDWEPAGAALCSSKDYF